MNTNDFKMPQLSEQLKRELSMWKPYQSTALLVLQDEASSMVGTLHVPEVRKKRVQMSIGTGWVISKADEVTDLKIGDRVRFPAGVTIASEFSRDIPEIDRVHILHLQNLIFIYRLAGDDSASIQES